MSDLAHDDSLAGIIIRGIDSRIARSSSYHYEKTMALKQRIAVLESAEQRHQGEIVALLEANKTTQRALIMLMLKKPWWKFW